MLSTDKYRLRLDGGAFGIWLFIPFNHRRRGRAGHGSPVGTLQPMLRSCAVSITEAEKIHPQVSNSRNAFPPQVLVQSRVGHATCSEHCRMFPVYINYNPRCSRPHAVLSSLHVRPVARQERRGPRRWLRRRHRRPIPLQEAGSRPVQPYPCRHASPHDMAPGRCQDGSHPR